MPIIQVERKQIRTQIKAAIETEVQERLRAYCRFSGATNDQVVSGALKFLFQSDAELPAIHRPERSARLHDFCPQLHAVSVHDSVLHLLSCALGRVRLKFWP